jgi:hypothetical protein
VYRADEGGCLEVSETATCSGVIPARKSECGESELAIRRSGNTTADSSLTTPKLDPKEPVLLFGAPRKAFGAPFTQNDSGNFVRAFTLREVELKFSLTPTQMM